MPAWTFSGPNPITSYVIGLGIQTSLSQDTLRNLVNQHRRFKSDFPRLNEQTAFTFNMGQAPSTGQHVSTALGGVNFDYLRPDGTISTALVIAQNQIAYVVTEYKRWKEYWPVAERILGILFDIIPPDTHFNAIFLQAMNNFRSVSNESSVDVSGLIDESSSFVAANLVACHDLAHSFHGYQAKETDPPGIRVDNTNVGVRATSENRTEVDITFDIRFSPDQSITVQELMALSPAGLEKHFKRLHLQNNKLFQGITRREIWSNIEGLSHS